MVNSDFYFFKGNGRSGSMSPLIFFIFFKKGSLRSGIYQECPSLAFPLPLLDLGVCLVYSNKKRNEKPLR